MAARALSTSAFAQEVGHSWRSLRPIVMKYGIGTHLNGRWSFDQEDVAKAKAILAGEIDGEAFTEDDYIKAHVSQIDKHWVLGNGTVYIIQGKQTRLIKIGYSQDIKQRLTDLRAANADTLEILCFIVAKKSLEVFLHDHFADHRLHGEWFKPAPKLRRLAEDIRQHGQAGFLEKIGWKE